VDALPPRGPRVAFVVCPPYQGATLLDVLLNNHSQISAPGECSFPLRSGDLPCACGARVSACEFWQAVRAGLDPGGTRSLQELLPPMPWPLSRWQLEWGRVRVSPSPRLNRIVGRAGARMADVAAPTAWGVRRRSMERFVERYRDLYRLVLEMHGTSLFIDGFKSWRKTALLARELEDVRTVHLVRDPRGFAASRRRHLGPVDVRESGWLWADIHRRISSLEEVAPYRLLRYEDLAVRPEEELSSLFAFLGVEPESVVAAPRDATKHHVVGNEGVRTRFSGTVWLDSRWEAELSAAEQRAVLAAAGPFAAELGYGAGEPGQRGRTATRVPAKR
jgi:Sulfotransferase domain